MFRRPCTLISVILSAAFRAARLLPQRHVIGKSLTVQKTREKPAGQNLFKVRKITSRSVNVVLTLFC